MRFVDPLRLLLFATVFGSVPGCTLLVGFDPGAEPASCTTDAECLPGWRCGEGTCAEATDAIAVPASCQSVSALEGTVPGPEPWSLRVPAGALPGSVCVDAAVVTATTTIAGHDVLGPAVRFSADRDVEGELVVRFAADAATCAGDCTIFLRDDDGWRPLAASAPDGGPSTDGFVEGHTPTLGVFVAARISGGPPDAGVVDGGGGDGGGGVDAGGSDGGQIDLADLFASCDLTATSCTGGLACVPDPFDPTTGVCLTSCAAGGAACISCGEVGTLAGQWCRPNGLSGAGGTDASCATNADCDAATTNGCVDFGDGAGVCAATCDPGAPACGAGCCASGTRDGQAGAYCQPAGQCTAPDGSPCLTDAACAGGSCVTAPDGAQRCASACDQSGGCGAGLCCLPASCDGAGMCVADDVCAGASALVCGAVCLDDAACPGVDEFCIDGACTTVAGCECFTHSQCAPNEFCEINAGQAAACTTAGDDPCCGACTALPAAGACYADEACPPIGDATAVLCALPGGCAADPFGQCEGSCRALATAECVSSSDCGGGQICVDHVCL